MIYYKAYFWHNMIYHLNQGVLQTEISCSFFYKVLTHLADLKKVGLYFDYN